MNILCLDIGGTHTRAALVGNDGLVEKKVDFPGDFAGRFQVVLPSEEFQSDERFKRTLRIENFTLDPSLSAMKDNLASTSHELIVDSIWCHTLYQQAGLAVTSVELKEQSE